MVKLDVTTTINLDNGDRMTVRLEEVPRKPGDFRPRNNVEMRVTPMTYVLTRDLPDDERRALVLLMGEQGAEVVEDIG